MSGKRGLMRVAIRKYKHITLFVCKTEGSKSLFAIKFVHLGPRCFNFYAMDDLKQINNLRLFSKNVKLDSLVLTIKVVSYRLSPNCLVNSFRCVLPRLHPVL